MPLYLRRYEHHYPDDDRGREGEHYVVLSGSMVVGGIRQLSDPRMPGRWQWTGMAAPGMQATGMVDALDEGKHMIASGFRAWCAWAALGEMADARPGPAVRRPAPPISSTKWQPPTYDASRAPLYAMQKLPPLQVTVRSGGLVCGVMDRATRGPEAGQWFWFITGPQARVPGARENDRGLAPTLEDARAGHAAAWGRWLQWAGLVQVQPLTCGR